MPRSQKQRREESADKRKPHLRISPTAPLTHHELIIDFLDGEPGAEFVARIDGPIAQPYFARLKTDPQGNAQIIWRTQQAGDYEISIPTVGKQTGWEGGFTVLEQAGLRALGIEKREEDEAVGNVPSVEPPSRLEPDNPDTLSQEARVARGDEDPAVLGEVDQQYLDAAGETQDAVENATTKVEPEAAPLASSKGLNMQQLKDELKSRDLPVGGNKKELSKRLDKALKAEAKVKKEPKEEGGGLPQYNYRVPGEPETIAAESKESPDGDPSEAADEAKAELEQKQKAHEVDEGEVSPNHGQSDPQTQLEADAENTWSGPGGRGEE